MDLSVELPGEGVARVSVPGTARMADVVRIVYQQKGLGPVAEKLTEFSLAKKGANDCIDVVWLDPVRPLHDQGPMSETLVVKKKYFVRNDELQALDSSETLLRVLFTQLLQSFKAGLFKCSVFQAAQIVATVLKVQQGAEHGSPEPFISDEDLKSVLPEHLCLTAGIDQLVAKAMKTLKHISVQEAQKRFVARLQKLEAFGMAFYSAEYEECSGYLGIGPDTICCIEREGMETFNQWDRSDLSNYAASDTSFTMVFGTDNPVTISTPHGHMISDFIKGVEHLQQELKYSPPPITKPEQDQAYFAPKVPPATKATAPYPAPEKPPPRRPVPAPRSGRLASISGDTSNPGGGGVTAQKEGALQKPRARLASSGAAAKGAAVQPERVESPVEAYEPAPVAYLEPKKSVHRIPPATAEPVFGVFQKKPERPSLYATVRDSVDVLSIILESDLNSELSLSAEENPIYDANASKEVEICIRSCNATYKALNQSFKQSFKQKVHQVKTKSTPPPPASNKQTNGGQQKKVPLLPPAPSKPPPPWKPPPILVKGGGATVKQSSFEMQPNNGGPGAGVEPGADMHHPLPNLSKPKITKVSVSKATEEGHGGARAEVYTTVATSMATSVATSVATTTKGRSRSVTKDTRPHPNIADKVEAASYEVSQPVDPEVLRTSKKSGSASDVRPPKPPRAKKIQSDEEVDAAKRQPVVGGAQSHDMLDTTNNPQRRTVKNFTTLQRDFRIFYVKLPNGHLYTELEDTKAPLKKMIYRLCALIQADDYSQYSLYVEGSALSVATSREGGEAVFDVTGEQTCILLPEQGTNAVLLDPEQSLYKQGVHSTRILALRKNALCSERLRLEPPNPPEWIQFYKYSTGIVQGTQPCSLHDAVKLAALHYQVCILDRNETDSVIELCSAEDFVSYEYSFVRGVADKVHAEHQQYREYTLKEAQESYIQICQGLPTHNTIFFPCKEVKQRALLNNKLTPILIGINHDGVVRVDPKTKEILDMWPYQVIQNWGFGSKTLMLHFADSSYPVKTNQGNWMTELIDFNVDSIVSKPKHDPGIAQNYEQDPNLAERLYEELLCVEESSMAEYDVLQHFPAHHPPCTFPTSGDYEPVMGGGVYSTLSADLIDNSLGEAHPEKPHAYEVITPHV